MKLFVCLCVQLLNSAIVMAQPFSSVPGQGRSMVVTKFGIVSTPQFLASQAGAHILEEGGNAIDAAIAANAVMGVVQPYVNGIGGDLFVLYSSTSPATRRPTTSVPRLRNRAICSGIQLLRVLSGRSPRMAVTPST